MDAINNKKINTLACKVRQRLISKAPKRAYKEIFKDSTATGRPPSYKRSWVRHDWHWANQAIWTPFFEKYFKDSWQAVLIKPGTYLVSDLVSDLERHLEITLGNMQSVMTVTPNCWQWRFVWFGCCADSYTNDNVVLTLIHTTTVTVICYSQRSSNLRERRHDLRLNFYSIPQPAPT